MGPNRRDACKDEGQAKLSCVVGTINEHGGFWDLADVAGIREFAAERGPR